MKGRAKVSYIHNGRAQGSVAARLLRNGMDVGVLRPYEDKKGRSVVCLNTGRVRDDGTPILKKHFTNADATLRKEEWQQIDRTVIRVQRDELRVWQDWVGMGLTYDVPNPMGTTVVQHQTMTDSGEATLSMSPLRKTKRDRVEFGLDGVPLPIVHSDWSFDIRSIEVSRKLGLPIDTLQIEQCTRKCMETIEDWFIGTLSSYSYAGYTGYGLTNHPQRLTKTLTLPTAAGWTPDVTYEELLDMIQQLDDVNFGGPYGVYFSRGWTKFMSRDYSQAYPGATLRSKLNEIDEISFVRKAHRLANYQILVVQLSGNTVQIINGMPLRSVVWAEEGGMEIMGKVMGIMAPRLRTDADNIIGINHGVAA